MAARAKVGGAEADVRGAALGAATRLFAKRGFEATSIQDIATEVGVTKPAILHHFSSKEELRRAVFAAILDHWRERLPTLLLAATASEDRFDGVLGELCAFFAADRDRARLVVREMLDRPDEMRELMRAHVRPWIGAVALYVERGKEKGEHHAGVDAEAYTLHMLSLVITTAASEGVVLGVLDGQGASARYAAELRRVARASLFAAPSGPGAPRPPGPKTSKTIRPKPSR